MLGIVVTMIATLGGLLLGGSLIFLIPGISHETGKWLFVVWMVVQTIIFRYIEIKITDS